MSQKLIVIGASTGGPGHIKKLLKDINLNGATVVIAQHMNKMFIPSFAAQIAKECSIKLEILKEKTILKEKVYVCEKNFVISDTLPLSAKPNSENKTTFTPNVDMLFDSCVNISKSIDLMAILLTGIGDDGASGLDKLQKAGAKCIAENEESAIVYGMPKRAKELNPTIKSLNLTNIKKELEGFLNVI
ncbi:MCP protein-glutamate methylesterase [Campylobacter pinnipediorum subsp. caledonicus]|uniref:protein-glutamate methylesterase n=1 Tax=Campylobacter pinnipediorum subsp. caledonicus TaxID=1874362 RepID=A0A1S6U8G5_9BACT|nr:CheB methylesterase domain-containing protein [Campylobacter pinnipediorum]AQW86309.1 MCP protein-glutamate methylesterase [Campylobacter pinnipediorum subsp. caledonicus]AQW87962.1 MCP protein-glutamate methylesterase [Campylobacter pinnipediorum subsp. caledonicus]OPA71408.1 chemotaxis protein CheB [Campylobacter pinnipediorum subsp. caledonicus]OPA79572.1 chemotaxis protein CheB [Campylobacter pinnipediorum subsp. pinnipediorum]